MSHPKHQSTLRIFSNILIIFLLSIGAISCNKTPEKETRPPSEQKNLNPEAPILGVTIDSIYAYPRTIHALKKLHYKPTVRLVFDPDKKPHYYQKAVNSLHKVSYIMGELLDSIAFKKYTVPQYKKRVRNYLSSFHKKIDIWEIGNEVNGEWLGTSSNTVKKINIASSLVKAKQGKTALTLYFNVGCSKDAKHEMFNWAQNNLSDEIRTNLDYVFISFYPDDCKITEPDWNIIFTRLHQLFPNSKLGFGEIGSKNKAEKARLINHYYDLQIDIPNYVGGYFWWYFRQDMGKYLPIFEQKAEAFAKKYPQ